MNIIQKSSACSFQNLTGYILPVHQQEVSLLQHFPTDLTSYHTSVSNSPPSGLTHRVNILQEKKVFFISLMPVTVVKNSDPNQDHKARLEIFFTAKEAVCVLAEGQRAVLFFFPVWWGFCSSCHWITIKPLFF